MNKEAKELWSFLKAVEKTPRDVVLRQAFADWLDEHNEPDLATEQRRFSLERFDAEQRLREIAQRYADGDYEGMVNGCAEGYYCFSSDSYRDVLTDSEFWEDIELIAGVEVAEDDERREGMGFRCGC